MAGVAAMVKETQMREVARRMVWGQTHTEIMAELAIPYHRFYGMVNKPEFKAFVDELERQTYSELDKRHRERLESVQTIAKRESIDAIETLVNLMKSSASESLRRDCANDVIKHSGEGEKERPIVVNIGTKIVQLLVDAAREDDERRTINVNAEPVHP